MVVVVTGDRQWGNSTRIRNVLSSLKAEFGPFSLIDGGARGADRIAAYEAFSLDLPTETIEADWGQYGPAAGPIRNRQMLDRKPDLVIAFHNRLAESRGTKDCVTEARRRGIPVRVFTETGEA